MAHPFWMNSQAVRPILLGALLMGPPMSRSFIPLVLPFRNWNSGCWADTNCADFRTRIMKRLLLSGLMGLCLLPPAGVAADALYLNSGTVSNAQVAAITF